MVKSRNTSPEEQFWNWFSANSSQFFAFERDKERLFDDLSERLARIHGSLCFEFGPVENGRREFIISADGDRSAFPVVQRLAGAAPNLPEWHVTPFRPPKNIEEHFTVTYEGVPLSVDDVWFSVDREDSITHIDLFIRGLGGENNARLGAIAYLMLDMALGEFVVETQVGGIARHSLPGDPRGEGLRPFRELPGVIGLSVH